MAGDAPQSLSARYASALRSGAPPSRLTFRDLRPEPVSASSTASPAPIPVRLVLTVLAPFAAGYFLSYGYRAVNAVVAPDLVRDVGLDASTLGVLTAAYLIAFALFQLPLGILLDRFGPRRVQAVLLCTAAAGSVVFSFGADAPTLMFGRALIGLGFAGGLMAGFKAVVLWFPRQRHALANALIMSFGGLGLIAATVPAELAVQAVGWRGLFLVSAGATVLVAAVIFLVVPEHPLRPEAGSGARRSGGLGRIVRDPFFWRLAPLVALTSGTHIGIHTLWAGPWFRDVAGLGRDGVALHLAIVAAAFLIGALTQGVIADLLGRRGVDLLHVMLGILALFLLAQIGILFELVGIAPLLWFVFGMAGQAGVLAYPCLAAWFGADLSGRAQTAMNLMLFLCAFGIQAAIGAVIDLFPVSAGGGYDPAGYRWGFGIFFVAQLLALAWYFLAARRVAEAG